jgi:hypothetical protein
MDNETATNGATIVRYPSDDAYHNDRSRLSASSLCMFGTHPRKYKAWLDGEFEVVSTPAMEFGTFAHAAVFEPDTLDRYAVEPEDPERPGKSLHRGHPPYKQWKAGLPDGVTIVRREYFEGFQPLIKALTSERAIVDLLRGPDGLNEQAMHFDLDGRPMRCKLDRIIPSRDLIVDLKTCRSADPTDERNAWRWYGFGYHIRAFVYLEAYRQVYGRNACFVHVLVENEGAFPRITMTQSHVDSPAIVAGERETVELLDALRKCEQSGVFAPRWDVRHPLFQPGVFPLPGAILRENEFDDGPALTIGGEGVGL